MNTPTPDQIREALEGFWLRVKGDFLECRLCRRVTLRKQHYNFCPALILESALTPPPVEDAAASKHVREALQSLHLGACTCMFQATNPAGSCGYCDDLATLEAALEADAHSEADCFRAAAEWLESPENLMLPQDWPEALRAEADRREGK